MSFIGSPSGGAPAPAVISVAEQDGNPDQGGISKLIFPNNSITGISSGEATVNPSGAIPYNALADEAARLGQSSLGVGFRTRQDDTGLFYTFIGPAGQESSASSWQEEGGSAASTFSSVASEALRLAQASLAIGHQTLQTDIDVIFTFVGPLAGESVAGNWLQDDDDDYSSVADSAARLLQTGLDLGHQTRQADDSTVHLFIGPAGQESTAGNWINLTASSGVSDGDKGDVVVSSSGAVWTIDQSAVNFSKFQDIAADRLVGRVASGSGVASELARSDVWNILKSYSVVTFNATIQLDLDSSRLFEITLTGNLTDFQVPSNLAAGQTFKVWLIQDGTGSRTWTPSSAFKFPGGTKTLSTAANAFDVLVCTVRSASFIESSLGLAYS